jgi:SAM-dependent methyltransferase
MSEQAAATPDIDKIKTKMKATWSAGDFGKIAESIQAGADEFIERLNIRPGETVLDVACGTGNLSIPAARKGASVTGVDIAPNLLEQARARAAAEGLTCKFDEGDAEDMPYADASFDTVITMFGAMFAPRPERTASELLRVCRTGGRVGMANWTPQHFVGQMFKIGAKHVPPPPGIQPPVLWGDEETARARFGGSVSDLTMTKVPITFKFPFPPEKVVEYFREFFGPTKMAFAALDPDGQASLKADLVDLWTENNRATDGTTEVEGEYLEVIATKA